MNEYYIDNAGRLLLPIFIISAMITFWLFPCILMDTVFEGRTSLTDYELVVFLLSQLTVYLGSVVTLSSIVLWWIGGWVSRDE